MILVNSCPTALLFQASFSLCFYARYNAVQDIARFLVESYGDSSTAVVIYEDAEPHYLIGTSTGSDSARFYLSDNLSEPCPVDSGDDIPCTPVRIPIHDLEGTKMDQALVKAFERQSAKGYPEELLTVKLDNKTSSSIFVSQSTLYQQMGAELTWRVIILAPGEVSNVDAILPGDPLFAFVIITGSLGFLACAGFLLMTYSKRSEKAVVYADWRFTCAFITGCVLLNGSSFTLLGKNTDATCLLRMWAFHLFFIMALGKDRLKSWKMHCISRVAHFHLHLHPAPLFVKIWRVYRLVGTLNIQRNSISNRMTVLYMSPMILAQAVILLIFTFVDPPRQDEIIENSGGLVSQRIVCDTETQAFFIIQLVFDAGIVFAGCVLAYLTRNMKDDFGEAKQLIFAMYNIAFVGVIVVVVTKVADLASSGEKLLQALGVLWGTVFSTGIFVIPRLLQVRESKRESKLWRRGIQVSGMDLNGSEMSNKAYNSFLDTSLKSGLDRIEEDDSNSNSNRMPDQEEVPEDKTNGTTSDTIENPPKSTRIDLSGSLASS